MFSNSRKRPQMQLNVADRNVIAGQELLQRHGFLPAAEHLGGEGHRNIIFEISSGDVWVRQDPLSLGAENAAPEKMSIQKIK